MQNIEELLHQLTLEEKVALLAGTNFMYTNPIPRLNIPSIRMSDGPHGLRVQAHKGDNGTTGSEPATSFPTAVSLASSWNEENAYKMGQAISEEALYYGVNILLGPGVCIKRNPLCGRNFEYFSEDPLLTGKIAAAEVNGVQSNNVGVSVKHFALNNAENYRFMGDSICDMRAIHEIYLKAFEIVVKESHPHTLMCSYNKINGTYCCENKWLLTDTLRKEWGYDGLVMSDWGATHDRIKGIIAGLDLEMPGDTAICRQWIYDAVKNKILDKNYLNTAVKNVLSLVKRYENNPKTFNVDWDAHNNLSSEIAEDCAVLLKNDGILPLNKKAKWLIVGDLFNKMRYQGAGSSMINPKFLTTPKMAFDKNKVSYYFCRGYAENSLNTNDNLLNEVLNMAKKFETIIVFAGLTDYVESEGADRETMRLPENQLTLIDALIKENKNTIVVLYGGSPIELPFANKVNAILNMYLPGQNGGTATYNLLFGLKSPSGKLAETWVEEYEDVPFGKDFSQSVNEIYKESIYVGYRYYLTANKKVRFPFGYGLSYTTFDYRNMKVKETETEYIVSCEIVNTGKYNGSEIVQLYVKAPLGVFKPLRELKGFAKVYLKINESKKIEIKVKKDELKYWNILEKRWVTESGKYEFCICSDCQTTKLSQVLNIIGDEIKIPYSNDINSIYSTLDLSVIRNDTFESMSRLSISKLPVKNAISLESRFTDMKTTFLGKILYNAVLNVAKKEMKKAKVLPEGLERDNKIKGALFLKRILESNSIITMSMSSGSACPYNYAQGFVNIANGHLFKGIKCFCSKIKAPELPKNKEINKYDKNK